MGATPLLLDLFAKDEQGKGYSMIAAGLSVMMIITSFITASTTRERITPPKGEKVTFLGTLRTLRGNDQLLLFVIVVILFNLGWYLMNALAPYFFDYVAENNDLLTIFAAVSGVAQAGGLILMAPLSKRFGKQNVFKGGIIAAILGYCMLLFVATRPTLNVPMFFAFDLLACLGIGCVFTAEMSMFADLVDYGQFKLGQRTESIVYSMKSFQMKAAQMIQVLIIGIGLDWFGYQESVHPQPQGGQSGIVYMMFMIPPVLALIALVLFALKYKLHSSYLNEVQKNIV
jgi:melibiose permease